MLLSTYTSENQLCSLTIHGRLPWKSEDEFNYFSSIPFKVDRDKKDRFLGFNMLRNFISTIGYVSRQYAQKLVGDKNTLICL